MAKAFRAEFVWRSVSYTVTVVGRGEWSNNDELHVERDDGMKIRGSKMGLGMVQTGISEGLERAARRALDAAEHRR